MQADFTQKQAVEEGGKEEGREEIQAGEQDKCLDSFENWALTVGMEMTITCVFVAFPCRPSQRGFSLRLFFRPLEGDVCLGWTCA